MNDIAAAFELPQVRAAATAAGHVPDRLSVRDYIRSVEIGAFATERGVGQRLRFNVVLEVCHSAAAEDDDVDKVLSYDTLTDAIEGELARERVNLLETLAERIARRCLADRRALRAFVRIEKLDRVPGALGVEIVRARSEGLRRVHPAPDAAPAPAPDARVLFLPNAVLRGPLGPRWLGAIAACRRPLVVALEPARPQRPATGDAAFRIGLLAIEENAWTLAGADPRFIVAASRAEIDWALRSARPLVWAPTKLLIDAVERTTIDASDPLGLAAWLAAELGASRLLAVASGGTGGRVPTESLEAEAPGRLADLASAWPT